MKKIKLISILLIVVTMFTVVGCANSGPSYWQIEQFTYADGANKEFFVRLSFDAEKSYEVWINIDNVEEEGTATISMAAGYSESSLSYKLSTITLTKELLTQANGWIKLNEGVSSSYEMIDVGTKYKMRINEIVVCDSDGNKFELKLDSAGERIKRNDNNGRITIYKPDDSSNSAAKEYFSKKNSPLCVIDNQDSFNRADVAFVAVPTSSSSTTITTSSK